jgi:hypothetical protein
MLVECHSLSPVRVIKAKGKFLKYSRRNVKNGREGVSGCLCFEPLGPESFMGLPIGLCRPSIMVGLLMPGRDWTACSSTIGGSHDGQHRHAVRPHRRDLDHVLLHIGLACHCWVSDNPAAGI